LKQRFKAKFAKTIAIISDWEVNQKLNRLEKQRQSLQKQLPNYATGTSTENATDLGQGAQKCTVRKNNCMKLATGTSTENATDLGQGAQKCKVRKNNCKKLATGTSTENTTDLKKGLKNHAKIT
jgi:hypothetical protein